VRWDYISFDKDKDYLIGENQDNYLEGLERLFRKYCNAKSRYAISGGLVDFHKIEISNSSAMANELYDIAKKIFTKV
jgi:hypothetical protein